MRLVLSAMIVAASASVASARSEILSCTIEKTGQAITFAHAGGSERSGHLSVTTSDDETRRIGIASFGGEDRAARLTAMAADRTRLEVTIRQDGTARAALGVEENRRGSLSRADCPDALAIIDAWRGNASR